MNQKYQPINCHFYDELELLAIRQKVCLLKYKAATEETAEVMDIIIDFQIKNQAEYLVLKNGITIRLDRLIEVDGKRLKGYC